MALIAVVHGMVQTILQGSHYGRMVACRPQKATSSTFPILQAMDEYAPEQVSRLAKLKKADMASEAERLADGTGWMPAIFRVETLQEMATEAESSPQDGTSVEIEQADTLAA